MHHRLCALLIYFLSAFYGFKAVAQTDNQIVLIIQNCQDNSRYTFEKTGTSVHLADDDFYYRDSNFRTHSYICSGVAKSDTLIIPTNKDWLEITHRFQAYERWSFLLKKGDTALINYENRVPKFQLINQTFQNLNLTYEELKRAYIKNDVYEFTGAGLAYLHPFSYLPEIFQIRPIEAAKKRIKQAQEEVFDEAEYQLNKEVFFLDSLYQKQLLSPFAYEFYKLKNKKEIKLLELKRKRFLQNVSITKEELMAALPPSENHLLCYDFQQQILMMCEQLYFHTKVKTLEFTQQRFPDFRAEFDSIQKTNFLSSKAKEILLEKCMGNIIQHFPVHDIVEYFKKYEAYFDDYSPEVWHLIKKHQSELTQHKANYIIEKYQLAHPTQYDLALNDTKSESINFSTIQKQNQGKWLYVDFWASWCGPCISAIPYSHEFRNEYFEDVSVIYISIDKKRAAWEKAAEKLALADYPHSYIVDYEIISDMLSQLKIKGIPRYLIYDPQGNLIYYEAPGPYGEEVRKVFDELIKG